MCLIAASGNGWLDPMFWFGVVVAVFALSVVVFVHELGHFVVAKMCGVKCMKFYVGFDPPISFKLFGRKIRLPSAIWKRQWGETEYGIGVLPLGGYVRMLGQDDNPTHEDESPVVEAGATTSSESAIASKLDPRNYQSKTVPQRMAIISAGVIMNVIFAFIFALIAAYVGAIYLPWGVKYTPCIVARTQPGDPAWRQNVFPGDKIVEINGVKNPRFSDLQQQVVLANAAEGLKIVIDRPGQDAPVYLTLKPDNVYVSHKELPRLGVVMMSSMLLNKEQPADLNSPAGSLPKDEGFKGGDKIVRVDGEPIADSIALEKVLVDRIDKPLAITVERKEPADAASASTPAKEVTLTIEPSRWRELGLAMTMGPIGAVREDSPAKLAKSTQVMGGIEPGDTIVAVDGDPVGDPLTLPMRLRSREGEEVQITVERPARAGENGGARKIDFTAKLEKPNFSASSLLVNSPASLLSLGVTYPVIARVAEAPFGQAVGKDINVGDEVTQIEFVPQSSPQTEAEKEEAKEVASRAPITISKDLQAWPAVMTLVQQLSPKTGIKLTLNGKKGARTVVLHSTESKEFYNANRGFYLQPNLQPLKIESFGEAVTFAWRETKGSLLQVVLFLKKMSRGDVSLTATGGPISIFRIAAMHAREGLGSLLIFLTLISANLAVLNFLPIPILDGGHMVFLTLEAIFRRPVSRRIVEPLTYAGALMLISLMIFTTVLDVQRLFNWL